MATPSDTPRDEVVGLGDILPGRDVVLDQADGASGIGEAVDDAVQRLDRAAVEDE